MKKPCRIRLLGAEVDIVTPHEMLEFVSARIAAGETAIVANHNAHSLHLYHHDPVMRAFYDQADLIEIDSTPLIAWARLMGLPVDQSHRSTYLDFREDFWRLVQAKGWRVYHVGGVPEHVEASRAAVQARYPRAFIDVHHGYFDIKGTQNDALLLDLHVSRPDILLIGMGMPRQENWIYHNLDHLPNCVILPVGAAFDYESGVQKVPPRWAGRVGLEWLTRFISEPSRLFTRYFVEPWSLVPLLLGDIANRATGRSFVVEPREVVRPKPIGFDYPGMGSMPPSHQPVVQPVAFRARN